jgi:DNA-binding MarR family transcriptional regulator
MSVRKGPLASPGYHLFRASLAWTSAVARALSPIELTHTQFFVLGALRWITKEEGRSPKIREVADFVSLDRMMTSQVVRALEERGFISRRDDPSDSRAWLLELTKSGELIFQEAITEVKAVDRDFFEPLGKRVSSFIDELESLARDES